MLAAVAGLAAGLLLGETSVTFDPEPMDQPVVSTSSSVAPPTLTPSSTRHARSQLSTDLRMLEDLEDLQGDVVVARPSSGRMWVIREGGSVVRRDRMPLRPGDFPYPVLLTGDRIVFTDLSDGYLIDADLNDPPEALSPASFAVPGAEAGSVWLVGTGAEWAAQVDTATGEVGDRHELGDAVAWVTAGAANGLIVAPEDEEAFGRWAYWTPNEGLQAVNTAVASRASVRDTSGELAIALSTGPIVDIVRMPDGETVSSFPVDVDWGDDEAPKVCVSPDARLLAIASPVAGEVVVVDASQGSLMDRVSLDGQLYDLAWSSADQLIYAFERDGMSMVQAFDTTTGTTRDIAEFQGTSGGWLTAGGTMC